MIREDEVGKLLQREGLLNDFLRRFGESAFSLTDYLKERRLLSSELVEELTLYSCLLSPGISLRGDKRIRPFTRDAYQRPYIPGTAIKGAMRTALWYHAMKSDDELREKRLKQLLRERKRKERIDDELDKDIFEGYRLRNMERSPNTDILRVIKVGDAQPWERDSLYVGEEETLANDKPRPDISIYLEYQKEEEQTSFSLTFDEELFQKFKETGRRLLFDGLEDFLKKVDAFYREVAREEVAREEEKKGEKVSRDFYSRLLEKTKDAGYLLRIGWGGGLPSITIWLALSQELRETMRKEFFKKSRRDKFPLTRRFLKRRDKEPYAPFGWVILKEVKG